METLERIFGKSPFEHVVEHATKIHECVALVKPVADAIVARDTARLLDLQDKVCASEYEADMIKDKIRQNLPHRFFLPVRREDMLNLIKELDWIGDDVQDFAVVATFRKISMSDNLREAFMAIVDKIVMVSETLLSLVKQLAMLQKESFDGREAQQVLESIKKVCHMEWEADKLARNFARLLYADEEIDAVTIMLLDKLCQTLSKIADHAENVGKNLRLMIIRR